jgi:hypothetical protein
MAIAIRQRQEGSMLGARLLQLIQAHAGSLTNEVIMDLRTNERRRRLAG